MKPNYFDIHSHLNFPQYDDDREEVIARMRETDVWTITVGVDLETSKQAIELAEKHDGFFATVGQHPTSTSGGGRGQSTPESFEVDEYAKLVTHPKVVAVGECGFDYFRVEDDKEEVRKYQQDLFEQQVNLALENNKPLMLHCRPTSGTMDAYEDVLEILNSKFYIQNSNLRGNVHFFVGNKEIAKRFLNLGFMLSFTAVITFARDYDEVIRYTPLDMIMSETDAPFVAPLSHRGKRNEPIYVTEIVRKIAEIKKESEEKTQKQMVENALRVFDITL